MRKFNVYVERNFTLSLPVNLCIKGTSEDFNLADYPNTEFIGIIEAKSYEEAMNQIKNKMIYALSGGKKDGE